MPILKDLALFTTSAALESAAAATTTAAVVQDACSAGNDFDGKIGARVSAIFVILLGSLCGAAFPVYARRHRGMGVPEWAFFAAKYFGSGVIIATAFIHLLAPANEALTNPCLTGPITDYPWVEGISLMTVFVLFFTELMAMRFAVFGHDHEHDTKSESSSTRAQPSPSPASHMSGNDPLSHNQHQDDAKAEPLSSSRGHTPGEDHLSHSRDHVDPDLEENKGKPAEDYAAQMTAIFILEFGVVFHSIFVGLTLAVAGKEFNTLYVVLVFHQTFEGLGLGSRLAATPWLPSKRWTPYILALIYGFSTPLALAVGLGVRTSYAPASQTALIVNGVFDSISAGILIYTGLVELMAHEFMFSNVMRKAPMRVVLSAYGLMCLGAGLMAILGKWA